jgi:tRNA/rRNA methyltransferase
MGDLSDSNEGWTGEKKELRHEAITRAIAAAGRRRRAAADNRDFTRPPMPAEPTRDPTRFVLIGTSHAGNVGASARAMKVMGFADLVLVAPRWADVATRDEALAMASGATDILERARVEATLAEALDGITHACATAMTPRDFGPPTHAPRELFASLAEGGQRVAFVFGSERFGMSNDDVYRCHTCVSIPTDPAYGSLNLAQAVQLIAYEWRQALGGFAVQPRTAAANLASAEQVQGVLEHWQRALVEIGFLDPAAPKKLLPRLNQLVNRADLSEEEVNILRGVARAILERGKPRG